MLLVLTKSYLSYAKAYLTLKSDIIMQRIRKSVSCIINWLYICTIVLFCVSIRIPRLWFRGHKVSVNNTPVLNYYRPHRCLNIHSSHCIPSQTLSYITHNGTYHILQFGFKEATPLYMIFCLFRPGWIRCHISSRYDVAVALLIMLTY